MKIGGVSFSSLICLKFFCFVLYHNGGRSFDGIIYAQRLYLQWGVYTTSRVGYVDVHRRTDLQFNQTVMTFVSS